MRLACLLFFVSCYAFSYPLSSLKVGGEKEAEIRFQTPEGFADVPSFTIKNGKIEFILSGAELDSSFEGNVKLSAPHALVKTLTASQEKRGLAVKVELNDREQNWKEKVAFSREKSSLVLKIGFPVKVTPVLEYAKSEQLPVLADNPSVKPATVGFGHTQWLLILGILVVAGISTFAVVKFLRIKEKTAGNRKYLIESLAHCSLGPKAGVSLVRVGREFVLVGVTPHQINLLSHVPGLQAQYEDETKFERESFKDAVDEEIARLKKEIAL